MKILPVRLLAVWLALVGSFVLLVVGINLLSSPCQWSRGDCLFSPELAGSPLPWVLGFFGLVHLLLVPGWLAASVVGVRGAARLGIACPLSVFLWVIVYLVLSVFTIPVTSTVLLIVSAGAYAVLLVLLRVRRSSLRALLPCSGEWLAVAAGVLIFVFLGPAKIAHENFSGDGVEAFGFTSSLHEGPLPQWDLENGTWGFYPTFMSFAYPLHLSVILGGASEAATRFPIVILAMGIAAFLLHARTQMSGAMALVLATVLCVLTSAWNYTYDPYFADIAEPTVTDLFFSLCLIAGVWSWRTKRALFFLISGALAVTALPAGFPFLAALSILGAVKCERRAWDLRALLFLVLFVVVLMTVARAINPTAPTKFSAEVFLSHHTNAFLSQLGPRQIMTQLWAFLVQSGGAPLLFLFAFAGRFRQRGEERALLVATLIYLAAVLLSPKRHPHYLTPVVVLLLFQMPRQTARISWSWCVLLAFLICGVLPNPRPEPDQRTRAFGSATQMVFSNERNAVDNADLLYSVLTIPPWRTESNWGPGKHAWVLYSNRSQERPEVVPPGTHLLFSEQPDPWSGFHLVTDNGTSFLYEEPRGWLNEQNKRGGCTSCWGPLLKIPYLLWDPLSRWRA